MHNWRLHNIRVVGSGGEEEGLGLDEVESRDAPLVGVSDDGAEPLPVLVPHSHMTSWTARRHGMDCIYTCGSSEIQYIV